MLNISDTLIHSQDTPSLAEYARPWKLITLALGVALLILGSFYHPTPDWDIPISLIMATLAYLAAPWSEGGAFGPQCCSQPGLRLVDVTGSIGASSILAHSS